MTPTTNTRPKLREVPLGSVLPPRPGLAIITMSPGQWDKRLSVAYQTGWVLLELDQNERPARAYRRPDPEMN